MEKRSLADDANVEEVKRRVSSYRAPPDKTGEKHEHREHRRMVRTAKHRGLTIEIETMQRVLVNGEELTGHMEILDDGNVHYHAIPNTVFRSSIAMVKQIIDTFPHDFGLEPVVTTSEEA